MALRAVEGRDRYTIETVWGFGDQKKVQLDSQVDA